MKLIKVAAAVLNQTPLAWDANLANIVGAIQEARRNNVSVLCLPELCLTGYGCEDAFHSPGLQRTAQDVLWELLPETQGLLVSVGLPLLYRGALFNTACLISDGRIAGFAAKQHLAGEGIHYEPRWFKRWPKDVRAETEIRGENYPIGDLLFDCGGVLLGFEICEDAWVANRPGGTLAERGVDIILNPSASHFAFDKYEVRRRFILEGSRAFNVSYIYANLLGNESGRAIYDGGAMIASAGKMLAVGPRFSFADYGLTTALIDIDATRMSRARTGSFRPQLEKEQPDCIRIPFSYLGLEPASRTLPQDTWETGPHLKEEEFLRAEALALFDYMRKSRSRGFVVSLSGGADSAAVAVLCARVARLGIDELGLERFLKKLSYWTELAPSVASAAGSTEAADPVRSVVRQMLTCVYQATRNSSETTRVAAQSVAEAMGAEYFEIDVDSIVQQYVTLIGSAIGRELNWARDDIALQNIQARTRAPSVWLLANLKNALLLSTSNRSEAAVGYATMDGDTSGGLSPIAGIDKAFLLRWLVWLEKQGPAGLEPTPALRRVNEQQPTAELRPTGSHQTDEADLMPYEVLDAIERCSIRDKLTPLEAFLHLETVLARYPAAQLSEWIHRFFRLWCRNQWKRERYAPSFHLDDENLDPKTWCRFPILSGGFERELGELRAYLAKRSGTAR